MKCNQRSRGFRSTSTVRSSWTCCDSADTPPDIAAGRGLSLAVGLGDRLPSAKVSPGVIACIAIEAIAAVDLGWCSPSAGTVHGRTVDVQGSRADEVTAVAAREVTCRFVAERRRAQVARTKATRDGEVCRVAAVGAARGRGAAARESDVRNYQIELDWRCRRLDAKSEAQDFVLIERRATRQRAAIRKRRGPGEVV